jgi:hypothetical protein
MNILLSIIFTVIIPFLFLKQKYNTLFVLLILSLIGNLFNIGLIGQVGFYSIISVLMIAIHRIGVFRIWKKLNIRLILKYELFFLFCTGIVFTVIIPWESSFELPVSQTPIPKAIIGYIRIFSDVILVLIVPYFLYKTKYNVVNKLLKLIFYILLTQLIISIIDYFSNYLIRDLLFMAPQLEGRFIGFNHEPRAFGRNVIYSILLINFLSTISSSSRKVVKKTLVVAYISLILTFSLSSYIALFVLIIYDLLRMKSFILNTLVLFIFVGILSQIKFIQEVTAKKFTTTFIGNGNNEFNFSSLPFYDFAYVEFINDNPLLLFMGTGPNLINIAYEDYAIQDFKLNNRDYDGYYVSTGPTFGLFRYLARSGVFGLLLLLLFVYKIRKKFKDFPKSSNYLNFINKNLILFLLIYTPFFYFNIGILLYYMNSKNKINESQ